MLPILQILPDVGGYKVVDGNEVETVKLKGGLGRYRRDQLGATAAVSWNYTTDGAGYDYVSAFFRQMTGKGSQPFQMWLMFESQFPRLYTCYFVPGSLTRPAVEGLTYKFGADCEVMPLPENVAADLAIIAAWNPPAEVPTQAGLDYYAPALAGVYSTSRWVGAYQGPLIQVRRTSDQALLNIGPGANDFLDLVTLAAFISGSTGTVSRIYDQLESGNDATQPSAANQPAISAAGVITYNGASHFTIPPNNIPKQGIPCAFFIMAGPANGVDNILSWNQGSDNGDPGHARGIGKFAGGFESFNWPQGGAITATPWGNGAVENVAALSYDGALLTGYLDAVQSLAPTAHNWDDIQPDPLYLGSWDNGGLGWHGTISTFLAFNGALAQSDITTIQRTLTQ